jgi:hypothetical protein
MWNLTSYDVNRIKGQLQARRARIDAKYAEDTKALDGDFADLETLERVAGGLALKYKSGDPADPAQAQESSEGAGDGGPHVGGPHVETAAAPEPQVAAISGDASGADAKLGSRWRLALRDRPVASEAE